MEMEAKEMEREGMRADLWASFFGVSGPLAQVRPDCEAQGVFDMVSGAENEATAPEKAPGGETEATTEVKAYVLAYDLPSEYRSDYYKPFQDKEAPNHKEAKEAMRLIRAVRIKATSRLYSCGLPATNSVIVVPTRHVEKAKKVIEEVKGFYEELNKKLKEMGFPELPEPLICVIPQVSVQVVRWASLAERELSKKLDKAIEEMAKKMEELGELEAKKAKSMKYRLKAQLKELKAIEEMAKDLGIDITGKAELLSSMLLEAIKVLEDIEEEG